jgi:hypothetical protein
VLTYENVVQFSYIVGVKLINKPQPDPFDIQITGEEHMISNEVGKGKNISSQAWLMRELMPKYMYPRV